MATTDRTATAGQATARARVLAVLALAADLLLVIALVTFLLHNGLGGWC